MSAPLPKFPPDARLFFLYGGDLGKLSAARRELLSRLVPADERDSLLVEIEPAANRLTPLDQIASRIMEELGTPAFFPGQRRVVVVTGIQDIVGGGGGGRRKKPAKKASKSKKAAAKQEPDAPPPKSPSERMVAYLNGEFREETGVLIVIAEEDEDKMRKVRDDDPLVAHLLGKAVTLMFREPPIRFEFEQAIYDRNAIRAVELFRDWYSPDTRAAVFAALSHTVRIMLQVRVRDAKPELRGVSGGGRGRGGGGAEAMLLENYFPKGRGSLSSTHPFALKKAERGARRYSMGELVTAHSRLLDLNDAFFPPRGAEFVPDLPITVEHFILRLCS